MSALSADINFTVPAADKVACLIREENEPGLNLRVFITGGGCSGFQYGFTFDKSIQEDDTVVKQQCSDNLSTVNLLIDSMSYPYLKGATIDYESGLEEKFKIINPQAKTTCGCGSSFSMDDE